MFKNAFLKQLIVAVSICLMSAVCSYGQGGGIIDVAIQQRTAEAYELSLDSRNGNQLKVTLTALDGTIYLEKLVSSEVVIDNLSSGAYQLITEDQTGLRLSHFLRLED